MCLETVEGASRSSSVIWQTHNSRSLHARNARKRFSSPNAFKAANVSRKLTIVISPYNEVLIKRESKSDEQMVDEFPAAVWRASLASLDASRLRRRRGSVSSGCRDSLPPGDIGPAGKHISVSALSLACIKHAMPTRTTPDPARVPCLSSHSLRCQRPSVRKSPDPRGTCSPANRLRSSAAGVPIPHSRSCPGAPRAPHHGGTWRSAHRS